METKTREQLIDRFEEFQNKWQELIRQTIKEMRAGKRPDDAWGEDKDKELGKWDEEIDSIIEQLNNWSKVEDK